MERVFGGGERRFGDTRFANEQNAGMDKSDGGGISHEEKELGKRTQVQR